MSLLLKALKQAETTNAGKADADRFGPNDHIEDRLELESMPESGTAQAREWVEPPDLIFGSSDELSPKANRAPSFNLPQLSLVPLTALLAALVAVGYGIYLYFALQPPAAIEPSVTTLPASSPVASTPPSAEAFAPVAPVQSASSPATWPSIDPAVAPPASAPSSAQINAGQIGAAPVIAPATTAESGNAPTHPERAAAEPRASTSARNTASRPAPAPVFQPDVQSTVLNQAYLAYQRGALAEAKRLYTQAAARGRNIDALLGLAAIASAQKHDGEAQRLYRDVLDLDPLNATAQGALLDLLGNTDNQATESRLKMLIEREPSAHLYQTLGNLYADQKRWNDAQAAYFEAYRNAPGNGDYAFNLAVSLDQLRQFSAARTYYEKALASDGVHRFDRIQAETRVQQLKSAR